MSEYRLKVIVFAGGRSFLPKNSGRRKHPIYAPTYAVRKASKYFTTLLLKVFTQRNFVADSSKKVHFKQSLFVLESPLGA